LAVLVVPIVLAVLTRAAGFFVSWFYGEIHAYPNEEIAKTRLITP